MPDIASNCRVLYVLRGITLGGSIFPIVRFYRTQSFAVQAKYISIVLPSLPNG
jgi:hypothetical protein